MNTQGKKPRSRNNVLFLVIALFLIFVDQLTKFLALKFLEPSVSVEIIDDVLRFILIFNDRAAFSLGGPVTWIFTVISTLAALALLWFGPRWKTRGWRIIGAVALGGVVGNLIDRLIQPPGFPNGYVIDFIQLPFNLPIFNIADVAITTSAFLIAIRVIRGEPLGGKS